MTEAEAEPIETEDGTPLSPFKANKERLLSRTVSFSHGSEIDEAASNGVDVDDEQDMAARSTEVSRVSGRSHGERIYNSEDGDEEERNRNSTGCEPDSARSQPASMRLSTAPEFDSLLVLHPTGHADDATRSIQSAYWTTRLEFIGIRGVFHLRILCGVLLCSSAPAFTEKLRKSEQGPIVLTTLGMALICGIASLFLSRYPKVARFYDAGILVIGLLSLLLAGLVQDHLARIAALDDGQWHSEFFLDAFMAMAVSGALGAAALASQLRWWSSLLLIHIVIPANLLWALLLEEELFDEERQDPSVEVISLLVVNGQLYILSLVACYRQWMKDEADQKVCERVYMESTARLEEYLKRWSIEALRAEHAIERLATENLLDEISQRHEGISVECYAYPLEGDDVVVLKPGPLQGKTGVVENPFNNNGFLTVLMDEADAEGRLKHYLPSDVRVLPRGPASNELQAGDRVMVRGQGKDVMATVVKPALHGLVRVRPDDAPDKEQHYPSSSLERISQDQSPVLVTILSSIHGRNLATVPLPSSVRQRNAENDGHGSKKVACGMPLGKVSLDDFQLPAKSPNQLLSQVMAGEAADWLRIRKIAERIRDPDYGLREFFDDCSESFPELKLFFVLRSSKLEEDEDDPERQISSSARSGEEEYQRTMGALFAVYWLFRIEEGDGRQCFCYGVDQDWKPVALPEVVMHLSKTMRPTTSMALSKTMRRNNSISGRSARSFQSNHTSSASSDSDFFDVSSLLMRPWSQLTAEEKRLSFYGNTDWSMFTNVITQAGCSLDAIGRVERTMAILCLTAFHDIMKVEDILPVVQPGHGQYQGYDEGFLIRDHDVALSYVLEFFPDLIPSFAGLPKQQQRAVVFTQSKMSFNHGWFVQAEAPPGAMLSRFKSALSEGSASSDVAFYFLHWLTDLAGAEATPLAGSEKFVLKFPHAVLSSFLWSIPYLERLMGMDETHVVESYLEARWKLVAPDTPVPDDQTAVACMRLVVMAQGDLDVVRAFQKLSSREQEFLAKEMARTGCQGQSFSRYHDTARSTANKGPAVLAYYAPALLQRNVGNFDDLRDAVRILCEVFRGARVLWPATRKDQAKTVTVHIAKLKALDVRSIIWRDKSQKVWVMIRHNDMEATVEGMRASQVNELMSKTIKFHILDFAEDDKENNRAALVEDDDLDTIRSV